MKDTNLNDIDNMRKELAELRKPIKKINLSELDELKKKQDAYILEQAELCSKEIKEIKEITEKLIAIKFNEFLETGTMQDFFKVGWNPKKQKIFFFSPEFQTGTVF